MSEKIEFEQKLRKILDVFRYIFKDDPIVKKIDRTYEDEIFSIFHQVPDSYFEDINHGIEIFKNIYLSIDLKELNERLKVLPFPIKLDMDVYKYSIDTIKGNFTDAKIRAGLISIAKKCKPILDCFTYAVNDPLKYLSKLIPINDSRLDSILK